MVKRITITLDDNEFEKWRRAKGRRSWFQFFKELVEERESGSETREAIDSELLRELLKETCSSLTKIASSCILCSKQEAFLRLCSEDVDSSVLARAFLVIMHLLEENSNPSIALVLSTIKVAVMHILEGKLDEAKEELKYLVR